MIILSGVFVGFCFDIYRIARWRLRFNKVLTFIGDLLFSFIALLLIYYCAQKANYLELRFYLYGASLLGLLLYLKFFSKSSKRMFNILFSIFFFLKNLVVSIIAKIFYSIAFILTQMMRIPYGLLRWFAMLLYRIGEALGRESVTKVKGRISKTPRQ